MTGWRTSSRCNFGGCVQVRMRGGRVELRDSNRPAEVAWFYDRDWAAFTAGVRAGEFDAPESTGNTSPSTATGLTATSASPSKAPPDEAPTKDVSDATIRSA